MEIHERQPERNLERAAIDQSLALNQVLKFSAISYSQLKKVFFFATVYFNLLHHKLTIILLVRIISVHMIVSGLYIYLQKSHVIDKLKPKYIHLANK